MDNNTLNNYYSSLVDDEGYESNDEIDIEITNYNEGKVYTQTYTVPYHPTHCNEKRLLCFSVLNKDNCYYKNKCTYAHSFEEQIIDYDRLFTYQIILDKKLMNFFSLTNPKTEEIYRNLLFYTQICDLCSQNKCTGGYNCRHGAFTSMLKICKNDLFTGDCINKLSTITVTDDIIKKISSNTFEQYPEYEGCINGHHLSERGLVPYYKYVHQKEVTKKNMYQSVRYIEIDPLLRIFKNKNNISNCIVSNSNNSNDTESSTDEEISGWFRNGCASSDSEDSETFDANYDSRNDSGNNSGNDSGNNSGNDQ